jgi:YidC/Oxa1 family membrane protein insertase
MPGFLSGPVNAAYHLVYALTGEITPLFGGLAAAVAIVVFTVAVRLLITPLSFRALHGQVAQAKIAAQLAALRQRHARQPQRLQRETTALYQREGKGMLAGLLPLLAQWPFFSVMYLLFRSPQVAGAPNQMLTHALFGIPLGAHWLSGAGALSGQGGIFLGVFAVLAALCWAGARVARRMSATAAAAPAGAPPAAPTPAGAKPGKPRPAATGDHPVAGAGAVRLLGSVLPYVTVVIAAFAPLAAGLYLITTVAWSSAERWLFLRRTARPH